MHHIDLERPTLKFSSMDVSLLRTLSIHGLTDINTAGAGVGMGAAGGETRGGGIVVEGGEERGCDEQ